MKAKIAKIFIPKNTPYCHHRFKENKNKPGCYYAKPCIFWCYKNGLEYCRFLKKELSIQDQVKDCGINEEK